MSTAAQHLTSRPHPDDLHDPARRVFRQVTVNLAESPLAWLHARGRISDAQLAAGERLRADYERAGLSPRVTMRWDAAPPARGRVGASPGASASLARIDAHRRFHAAMAHVGPGLADICWRVLCAGDAMTDAEKGLGWPARSGRLVLGLALDRLTGLYGTG
ncbi:MAG: hypothetical protein RLZZ58_62 [Pseudomonadota bacterium]